VTDVTVKHAFDAVRNANTRIVMLFNVPRSSAVVCMHISVRYV